MIETVPEMVTRLEEARKLGKVAVDTELVWESTFYPALGVVQVGVSREGCYLLDAVALSGQLAPLGDLLADTATVKILHDAVQDMTILRNATRASGTTAPPANLFDTRIAAGFVGLASTISLRDLLVELVDVELDKSETRTDWLQRPLAQNQVGYAEDDVRYLVDAHDELVHRAEAGGVGEWMRQEMATLNDPELYEERDPREEFRRVKGFGKMRGLELAALRELTAWREQAARDLDRPRGRVASDKLLLFLAQRQPTELEAFDEVRSFRRRDIDRHGQDIIDAVRRARDLDESEWPSGPPHQRHDRQLETRCRAAMERMREVAEARGIDPALVGTRSDLRGLVREGPEKESPANRLTRGWRWELVGKALADEFYQG
ncbi:MAG: HRDC domain-containing protein [bacterium]|nr:HRDC domain-containing protein [bacterium]